MNGRGLHTGAGFCAVVGRCHEVPPPGDPGHHKWVAQYDSAVIFGGEENPGGDLAQYLTLPKAQLAVAPVSDICNSVREGGKERFDGIAKSLTESTVSDAGQALKDSVVKGRLEVEDGGGKSQPRRSLKGVQNFA